MQTPEEHSLLRKRTSNPHNSKVDVVGAVFSTLLQNLSVLFRAETWAMRQNLVVPLTRKPV
jgi:hypothetical protein